MTEINNLFHAEEKSLEEFKDMVKTNTLSKKGLVGFIDNYADLITQSKVITRVSDRLQSKLNKANDQIAAKNEIIGENNKLLQTTVAELVQAKVSKKASTILFTAAIVLFVAEEVLLEGVVDSYVNIPYMGLIVKLFITLVLKSLESTIEKFFMRREQSKIVNQKRWEGLETDFVKLPALKLQESGPHPSPEIV